MDERLGHNLGHYRLLRLLGTGSFASVYLGEHRYLGRQAALKVLHLRLDEATFLQEARTIARLEHPHIIRVLDFGIEEQTPYLVLEYLPQGTLRARFPKGQGVPLEQIVPLVQQLASALDYAHQHRVIHRDVKPENCLLTSAGEAVLSDFGLAIVQQTLISLPTQKLAGTPAYMAPEQIQGHPCPASDQYALAVMVYEWLCGTLPFVGPGLLAVVGQHVHQPPASLCEQVPGLSLAVEDAVLGALAKDPAHRFETVGEFALALSEASNVTQPLRESMAILVSPKEPVSDASVIAVPLSPPSQEEESTRTRSTGFQPAGTQQLHQDVSLTTLPPLPHTMTSVTQPPRSHAQQQDRRKMLGRLTRTYESLLRHSLQGMRLLDLDLAEQPMAVSNAVNLLLRKPAQLDRLLPPNTTLLQVYDEAQQELLVLGEPGAGKSTLLLDLAQQLLRRAEADETYPLPVILPLSSWAIARSSLAEWLVEQLARTYDVPRALGTHWVEQRQILPLLDGLDEMAEAMRPACIQEINAYHVEQWTPLVICSRRTEYDVASARQRLMLQNAVVVQPLTQSQVEQAVRQGGAPLAALWEELRTHVVLRELASTPLMLSVLMLAYHGTPVVDLPWQQAALERRVWTDYVELMVREKGAERPCKKRSGKRYPLSQTCSWLGWLALQMRNHHQTLFSGELLLPDWLPGSWQRTIRWLMVFLPMIVLGACASALFSFFLTNITIPLSYSSDPAVLLQTGMIGGFLGWCLCANQDQRALAKAPFLRERRKHRRFLAAGSIALLVFASFGLEPYPDWMRDGIISGTCLLGSAWLLQVVFSRLTLLHPRARSARRWVGVPGWFRTMPARQAFWTATILGGSLLLNGELSALLRNGQSSAALDSLPFVLIMVLNSALGYGGTIYLVSHMLERQTGSVQLAERVSWTWRSLWRVQHLHATVLIILLYSCFFELMSVLSLALGFLDGRFLGGWNIFWSMLRSMTLAGRNSSLVPAFTNGLILGLSYWLLLGLYQGITQNHLENQDRRRFNQGLHRSLRNGMVLSLIGAGIITGIGVLSNILGSSGLLVTQVYFGRSDALNTALADVLDIGLRTILLFLLFSWLVLWAATSGLTILCHYTVRLLLARRRTFPLRTQRFLDDACARVLLRRVGGGYGFVHRRLLDYFADEYG